MKDIKGFEGLYGITSCGKVYSYKRKKFVEPEKTRNGYLRVTLFKDGNRIHKSVHRLVAEAYIPNPNNYNTVDHRNGNKEQNNIQNLQWLTVADNVRKANQKIVFQFNKDTLELVNAYLGIASAAKAVGASPAAVAMCACGKNKTCKGYIWRTVE